MIHFLRCATLFFHAYTDVPMPSNVDSDSDVDVDDVFVGLTSYLGLPNSITALLKVPGTSDLIDRLAFWSKSLIINFLWKSCNSESE